MATIKYTREKTVTEEVEFNVDDGIYYIGCLSEVKEWGKYYRVERIDIENSKVTLLVECLYLDSIRFNGKSLQHGVDKHEFEKIAQITSGDKTTITHGQREFISKELFIEYYNKTMENITKRMNIDVI